MRAIIYAHIKERYKMMLNNKMRFYYARIYAFALRIKYIKCVN